MDDQRDTRRCSCVCSDKHQFGLSGVPREHGGRACREVEISRGEDPFVLGRQKFPGVEKLLFSPCFPDLLGRKLLLHVRTSYQVWEWPWKSSPGCARALRVHTLGRIVGLPSRWAC